jgi:hypothetical protein
MVISTRLDPIDRDIDLIVSSELSPKAQSERIAAYAREQLADAQNTNRGALGYLPPHRTYVDARANAPLESVRPNGGIILFEFELVETMLSVIAEMLRRGSPVRSGLYQSSHALFADGTEVEAGSRPPDASEYAFINTQPYARKIERGLSPQAPEGVYHVVAELAAKRYGNIALVRFGFRSLPAGAIGGWARTDSARRMGRRIRGGDPAKQHDWLTRQPAVIVRPGGGRD